MASRTFAIVLVLVVLGECQSPHRGGVRVAVGAPPVMAVLTKAKVSGSLQYWGRCDLGRLTDFPKVRVPQKNGESPVQALREIFADDPEMRVTQDQNGIIRMGETDVPQDFLNVKISHISFKINPKLPWEQEDARRGGTDALYDPRDALWHILSTPELAEFRRAHDIEPFDPGQLAGLRGVPSPHSSRISGGLNDVTLSQALDSLLRSFPGLWVYENCTSKKYRREVFFTFYPNSPGWTVLEKR